VIFSSGFEAFVLHNLRVPLASAPRAVAARCRNFANLSAATCCPDRLAVLARRRPPPPAELVTLSDGVAVLKISAGILSPRSSMREPLLGFDGLTTHRSDGSGG